MSKTGVIGFPRRRVDGRAMTTGQTKYADDVALPRMVFAKLLRSPVPHARIASVDTARATAHPGVLLVLTGRDLPIPYGILPVTQDEHALAIDKVRFVGDPVALVVARDEATATEALDLIDVEYEPLKTIADYDDALTTNEPRIHDYGAEGNVHKKVALQFGDVDEGFAEADQIFEDTFFYEGNTHLPLEQHATVAYLDGGGKLVVMSSTQTPHYVHRALAKALEVPAAHIRVIATPNGGGFGGKSDPFNHEVAAAKAALILDRPVKITLTREEVFYCHRGRHPVMMKFRTGVKNDGTLTAAHLQTILDGGFVRLVRRREHLLYRRAPDGDVSRAALQVSGLPCVHEQGAVRAQARARHAAEPVRPGSPDRQDCRAARHRSRRLPSPHRRAAEHPYGKLPARLHDRARRVHPPRRRSLRVETAISKDGSRTRIGSRLLVLLVRRRASDLLERYAALGRAAQARSQRRRDGLLWSHEIGQGSDDVLVACVAEVLGIQPFDIRAVTGDTDLTPVDLGRTRAA